MEDPSKRHERNMETDPRSDAGAPVAPVPLGATALGGQTCPARPGSLTRGERTLKARDLAAASAAVTAAATITAADPEVDEVDAQSEQSFPASDPPSWSGSSISRGREQEVNRDPE